MADEPAHKKRTSEKQISSLDPDHEEDEGDAGAIGHDRAPQEELAARRIIKSNRRRGAAPSSETAPAPAAAAPPVAFNFGVPASSTPAVSAPVVAATPVPASEENGKQKEEVAAATPVAEEAKKVEEEPQQSTVQQPAEADKKEEEKKEQPKPATAPVPAFTFPSVASTPFIPAFSFAPTPAAGAAPAAPAPFFNFSFGAPSSSSSFASVSSSTPAFQPPPATGFAFSFSSTPIASAPKAAGEEEGEEDPEKECEANFKPVAVLGEVVEVKTGEEDETTVFKARVKLHQLEKTEKKDAANPEAPPTFSTEVKTKGVGEIRVLTTLDVKTKKPTASSPESGSMARVVMRAEGVKRVLLNCPLFPAMKVDRHSEKQVRFNCVSDGLPGIFIVQFSKKEEAESFIAHMDELKPHSIREKAAAPAAEEAASA